MPDHNIWDAYREGRPNPAELHQLKDQIMMIMRDPGLNQQHPASLYPEAPVVWGYNKNKLDNNTFMKVPFAKNLMMYLDDALFDQTLSYSEDTEHTPTGHAMREAMNSLEDEGEVIPLLIRINHDATLSIVHASQSRGDEKYIQGYKKFYVTS